MKESYALMTVVNYFKAVRTQEGATKRWRSLAKLHHPDIGGDTATMAEVNRQYQLVVIRLSKPRKKSEPKPRAQATNKMADPPMATMPREDPPEPMFDTDEYSEVTEMIADLASRFIKSGVRAFARRRRPQ